LIEIDLDLLREYVEYDSLSGNLISIKSRNGKAQVGTILGSINGKKNYLRFRFFNRSILNHRAAWALYYDEWPNAILDHKDQNKQNNKIDNLQLSTHIDNLQNKGVYKSNTSGVVGATLMDGKWLARKTVMGTRHYLGCFDTLEEAKIALAVA
jgi:hypothetical protein